MVLKTMYPPQKDSPSVFLMGNISASDTLITVSNSAVLPQTVPFPLTLGVDKTVTETVLVTAIGTNNQLTITRGTSPLSWVAGTIAGRVFTAQDLSDLQENVENIADEVDTYQEQLNAHETAIEGLETKVGDSTSGLVKGLADEITRATNAENTEKARAEGVELTLDNNKINRSDMAQVITNWVYSADGTAVTVTITRYNASTKQTTTFTRTLPVVSDETMGVMTPEAYAEITALRNEVNALQQQGGRFIGVSFATKAALDNYSIPASVKSGDFTYVIDDETKSNSTTRYIFNGTSFAFAYVIEYDPIGLANSTTPGLVKSDTGVTTGKIFVETDGTMSVVGWDILNNKVNSADVSDKTVIFTEAASKVNILTGETLKVILGKIKKFLTDLGTLAFKSVVLKTDLESSVQTSLDKADSALQSFTESDPTVSSWAKAATKPTYDVSELGAGTLGGQVAANATAVTALGNAQVRNISAGTTDLTAGTSALATGSIYFMYE